MSPFTHSDCAPHAVQLVQQTLPLRTWHDRIYRHPLSLQDSRPRRSILLSWSSHSARSIPTKGARPFPTSHHALTRRTRPVSRLRPTRLLVSTYAVTRRRSTSLIRVRMNDILLMIGLSWSCIDESSLLFTGSRNSFADEVAAPHPSLPLADVGHPLSSADQLAVDRRLLLNRKRHLIVYRSGCRPGFASSDCCLPTNSWTIT